MYIKDNLEKGYIRPSKLQYSSPFFFVGKKDGKLHPVVDYWKLNSFTVPDWYPLPLIQELVDKVKDAKLFTKIDIHAGYNNIRFREGDESKAAFKTNEGLFEPTVMPFGLRNAPAMFQRMVNTQCANILAEGGTMLQSCSCLGHMTTGFGSHALAIIIGTLIAFLLAHSIIACVYVVPSDVRSHSVVFYS